MMEQGLCSLGDHLADPVTGLKSSQAQRHANILEYFEMAESLGFDAVVAGAQYLRPQEVLNPRANGGRALSRAQIELLAGRVSALNQCFY